MKRSRLAQGFGKLLSVGAMFMVGVALFAWSPQPEIAEFRDTAQVVSTRLFAQLTDVMAGTREQLDVHTGDVIEIRGVSNAPEAAYDWVLSKDETFMQASKDVAFRLRPTEPGLYRIEATVTENAGIGRRTIVLRVRTHDDSTLTNSGSLPLSDDQIVTTDPPSQDGTIVLGQRRVLRIDPRREDVSTIAIDLDTSTDTDGDGDPANENDVSGSFIESAETPLFLWLTNDEPRSIRVLGRTVDGTSLSQSFTVQLAPPEPEIVLPPIITDTINVTSEPDGSLRFDVAVDPAVQASSPLVYEWSFGDGFTSMLRQPIHRYRATGSYDIRVTVRDVRDGTVVATSAKTVDVTVVEGPIAGSGSVASASSSSLIAGTTSSAASSVPATDGDRSGLIWTILKVSGVILLSLLLGAGAVWLVIVILTKRSGSRLEQALETMESKIVGKGSAGDADVIDVAPAPMTIQREEPEPEQKQDAFVPAVQETPPIDLNQAPSWLKKGLDEHPAEPAATPEPASPPEPAATVTESPSPVPGPEAAPPPLPSDAPAQQPSGELPSWLQPQSSPAPEPAPSEPTPEPSVSTPVETAPAEPASDLPSWLAPPTDTSAKPTAAEPTPPAPAAEPEPPVVPEPEPTPAPTPTPPLTPAPTSQPVEAPVTPAPASEAKAPDATTEAAPQPQPVETPAPTPALQAPVAPTPSAPAPATQTAAITPEEQARLDRERERKRLKRQRYRENLKKRKQEEKQGTAAQTPTPTPSTSEQTQNSESKEAVPTAPAPAQQPAQPAASPAPVPERKPPEPQDIPLQETPEKPAAATPDNQVVFMVQADALQPKEEPKEQKPEGHDQAGTQA